MALITATAVVQASAHEMTKATFAGGCFWCIEADFDRVPGVLKTISGYTGGRTEEPTYEKISRGNTGHHEALQITYDPAKVNYKQLLTVFWHSIDPIDGGGQFCDRGDPYQTAVFVHNKQQRKLAEASKATMAKKMGQKLFTPIESAAKFYPAESYHQDYYRKNPLRYRYYRWNCGRNQRVRELWGEDAYKGLPAKD